MTTKEYNINFKKYKVILFFLITVFQFVIAIFGIINNTILTILPFIIFIFPNTIWTLNFIHLFKKEPPLIIKKDEIIYSVINLKIKITDINLIHFINNKSLLLEVNLNNFEEYKRQLSKSLIGWLLLINYKFMKKNSIIINVSVFYINGNGLSNILKKFISKSKIIF